MNARQTVLLALGLAALAVCSANAEDGSPTIPGNVTTPFPTIHNLAIEWQIEGDENLNGVVTVRFRQRGADQWREAQPLRRVPAGQSRGTRPVFHWENMRKAEISATTKNR